MDMLAVGQRIRILISFDAVPGDPNDKDIPVGSYGTIVDYCPQVPGQEYVVLLDDNVYQTEFGMAAHEIEAVTAPDADTTKAVTAIHADADSFSPLKNTKGNVLGYTYRTRGGYGAVSDCGKTDSTPMPTRKAAIALLRAMRRDTARAAKVQAAAAPKVDTLTALAAIDNAHSVATDPAATPTDKANAYFAARNITDRI